MTFFQTVSQFYSDYSRKKCYERNCELKIDIDKEYIILDGDSLIKEKSSDCIIIVETNHCLYIIIAELKNKSAKAKEVIEKLENGSKVVKTIVEEYCSKNIKKSYYPLVLSKGWRHYSEIKIIKNISISISGKKHPILPVSCGYHLSRLLRTK
ncbi:MAG: hypothetical protein K9W45_02255 [Candidatus Heimdallarchaeum aukensis]|uniref:Uncharacterized protein n=1 Tax=Candidatus Heimdallarchaeum aukensis TaxID=2876573 RepID=A0A9Y1BLX6_9ARCH|nr:MAG: hypothetical protein K9W45_02255 [Candidatus Heimdallarchaeum aukensis]